MSKMWKGEKVQLTDEEKGSFYKKVSPLMIAFNNSESSLDDYEAAFANVCNMFGIDIETGENITIDFENTGGS